MSYYTKITTTGLAAITAAMNSNSKVPIAYMAFGDGNGSIPEPDENALSLVNEVYRTGVNKVEVHNKNPNWLVCEAIIPSAVGGFNIREVALYDNTGTKMLAVASYPPTYKPTVEEGAAKIQTIRIVLQVDNTGNFELVIDPDVVLATREYVDSTTKIDKIKFNNFINLEEKIKQFVSLHDYGAIGDGSYHPLSERYSTLDLAKFAYANISKRITSLNQSIDWAATQSAVEENNTVYALDKRYIMTDTIIIPDGHKIKGHGVDYWDSYRPNPEELLKSDENGTHFYFYGTGEKNHYLDDISNTLPSKSKNGIIYDLTHFTNQDSVGINPATPRMFSVGFKLGKNSGLEGCRIIPFYNGIQGYIDGLDLSDEWDVAIWAVSANDCCVRDVQAVGHWRIGGLLLTEHQSKSEDRRNPERVNFDRVWASGIRGLIVRNTPQYSVLDWTSSTISIEVNETCTILNTNKFKTLDGITRTYTTASRNGNVLTLSGITPEITSSTNTIRAWNTGNNFSNTVFNNCIFSSFDHVTGKKSTEFGLPVSGAAEYDGYPLRNIVHINTSFQTTYDDLNTIWGNCYDLKYIACKHENGQKIAYSNTQTKMFTMNIRMLAEDAVNAESWTLFTPRSGFNDALQIQQTFTDSIFQIQPLIGHQLKIMDDSSSEFLEALPGGVRRISFDNYLDIKKNGINNSGITLTEANTTVKNNLVASNGFQFSGTVRPVVDGGTSIGTSSFYLGNIFTKQVMFTPTCGDFSGVGSPEGVITAGIGSTYRRRDGLANTCFYVKESGTGNIGWVAK